MKCDGMVWFVRLSYCMQGKCKCYFTYRVDRTRDIVKCAKSRRRCLAADAHRKRVAPISFSVRDFAEGQRVVVIKSLVKGGDCAVLRRLNQTFGFLLNSWRFTVSISISRLLSINVSVLWSKKQTQHVLRSTTTKNAWRCKRARNWPCTNDWLAASTMCWDQLCLLCGYGQYGLRAISIALLRVFRQTIIENVRIWKWFQMIIHHVWRENVQNLHIMRFV